MILLLNFVFSPSGTKRSAPEQQKIDLATQHLSLYQYEACPFCVKVRRAIKRNSLKIELRDAKNNPTHREQLLTCGGAMKVPCLRIEQQGDVKWLYESNDIIQYLEQEIVAA
ncbi:glutaredoxin [Vibrio sp. S11_S32]|uniref:glutathione S-transferase N-terminal domain-containing protein n=1 Tax=Vibrio sp. S11_S32 TaxID=2720225 RepID=UPI00168076B7|nr:glutaredoxin [Vibrio sp. S11_S32]